MELQYTAPGSLNPMTATPYAWRAVVRAGDAARVRAEAQARWPDVVVTEAEGDA